MLLAVRCAGSRWTDGRRRPQGGPPRVGDVTVCIYCSAVLQYAKGFELKLAPAEVIAEVTLPLSQIQNALRKMRASDEAKKS